MICNDSELFPYCMRTGLVHKKGRQFMTLQKKQLCTAAPFEIELASAIYWLAPPQ
jgi:hypothetical protein